jgi:M6 family metalloprotease-like protein
MIKVCPLKISCLLAKIIVYYFLYTGIVTNLRIHETYAYPENPPPWRPWNVTGVQKLVVICAEFSDVIHSVDTSLIQTRLSDMSNYFFNVSLGRISVDVTFFGDHWEKLNKTMEYYGQDVNEIQDVKGEELIEDAVKAWDSFVNFSNYDCLLVIHAGEDQIYANRTELLWSRNYCYFGRSSKWYVTGEDGTYGFWGAAYNSEFNEYGIMAHEFGHSLGLPDLYVDNKFLPFDNLSLMARGCHNGYPQGTCPAHLDGFSMCMLGWLEPTITSLNSTEDVVQVKALGHETATLLKIPLSDQEYYLVEVRENSGYDKYTVSNPSILVYEIDEMRASKEGIATVLTGGIVTHGSTYSDVARGVFITFYSFNYSNHSAMVGLSTKLFIVDIDVPETVDCLCAIKFQIKVFDSNNNPVENIRLNISIGNKYQVQLITDTAGIAEFRISFGIFELGKKLVKISSSNMIIGEKEKEILVAFPWAVIIIGLLSILSIITLFYAVKYWKNKMRAPVEEFI